MSCTVLVRRAAAGLKLSPRLPRYLVGGCSRGVGGARVGRSGLLSAHTWRGCQSQSKSGVEQQQAGKKKNKKKTKGKKGAPSPDEALMNMCKNRGFVYPGSEIYNGFSSSFDYGPLGAQLKKNVSDLWWRDFVERRSDVVGLDSSILVHPRVWEAAGHVEEFTDPLVECRDCHERHRADTLVEQAGHTIQTGASDTEAWLAEIGQAVSDLGIVCPGCGSKDLSEPKHFNLLFETTYGMSTKAYMRPETAQGIFINFPQLVFSTRKRLPFGVGQVGKSFRNEISPGNFLFRTREFSQMELEYFVAPSESMQHFDMWVKACHDWLLEMGLRPDSLRLVPYAGDDLAHYADATTDIEFNFAFGWGELWGIAHRGDFDLRKHHEASGQNLMYADPSDPKNPFFPHVIEPAVGLDRLVLAFLHDAYQEETVEATGEQRVVLKIDPRLAPYTCAVLPLQKKPELLDAASGVFDTLAALNGQRVDYDVTQSIGKRYRRQDEIGTPYCVTVDYDTLEDGTVTVRCRDSMKQVRVLPEAFADAGALATALAEA